MLVKIDIEKVFDTVNWNTILATLQKMGFLAIWISWIDSYLSSASFSFVINGQPSPWCSSTRGICQGDTISPLLFLLVTQNLSAILNHSLKINFLSGFDIGFSPNFNHLMFEDDLIPITKASGKQPEMSYFA